MLTTAFIIGSGRSGTTIMENVLDLHPQVATWYEPVFIIDRFFQDRPDDRRTAADATPEVKAQARAAFDYFRQRRNRPLIIDKNPMNSFKLPLLHEIFPEAKFIHMLRDGRDVTRSYNIEWERRLQIVGSSNPMRHIRALKRYLDRQPLFVHKLEAMRFEIGSVANLLKGPKHISYRTRRWRGHKGFGPQFGGWEAVIDKVTSLEFNAMQWRTSVETIEADRKHFPPGHFLEVRYEYFLQDPEGTLKRIFDFLELEYPPNFMARVPALKSGNYDKWRTAFTAEEKALIGSILNPLLMRLGYAESDEWYTNPRDQF